ncbi:hypothetical protein CVD28_03580 [Bacillus sp. M6-12]|uniref:hypothetical protein n=1 Tax=Bacillus sp. M6-12 TaxID=2054166 RepID=UPI000C759F5A|nr:hypothetical protein [Bacillus sp. M6-12]PLS19509.1 hypothetical protein CVD28_03580 [Bacillus sp. M6-12]
MNKKKMMLGGLAVALLLSQGVVTVEAKSKPVKVVDKNKDGIADDWQTKYKLGFAKGVEKQDKDKDGLTNLVEYKLNLNPTSTDSDKDKILDVNEDFDKDGVSNISEIELGLSPEKADSDGDRILDGKEQLGKSKVALTKQIRNFELQFQTSNKKVGKIQYKMQKKGNTIVVKDPTGTITKEMVSKLVTDIQSSSLTKEDLLKKIQTDLALPAGVKIHVNAGFFSGKEVKSDLVTKQEPVVEEKDEEVTEEVPTETVPTGTVVTESE